MHHLPPRRVTRILPSFLLLLVAATIARAEDFAPLRRFMESSVEEGRVIGCAAQVTQDGRTIFLEAFGDVDTEGSRPLRVDDVVRIYSMTKAITTTAAMMLMEDGRLGLDDPVSKYIPEFAEVRVASWPEGVEPTTETMELVPPDRPVTVRDLILHTSGLGYSFTVAGPLKAAYTSHWRGHDNLEAAAAHLATLPLARQPGTGFTYGLGTDVLGRVVEVASGQPFEVFLEERLFTPLGMVDTGFTPAAPERTMMIASRGPRDGTLVPHRAGIPGNNNERGDRLPLGGQGLYSTLADYTRFCRMILREGRLDGTRYLRPRTVRFMAQNHLGPDISAPGMRFGMGFALERPVRTSRGPRGEGRLAWSGAASTFFFIDLEQDVTAVYVTQLMPWDGGLGREFSAAVLESLALMEPVRTPR